MRKWTQQTCSGCSSAPKMTNFTIILIIGDKLATSFPNDSKSLAKKTLLKLFLNRPGIRTLYLLRLYFLTLFLF